MEANFLTQATKVSSNGNGKSHVSVVQEPELRAQGVPGVHVAKLVVETHRGPEFIDITESVQDLVTKTGVKEGNILVFSRHTTAGVVIQEHEPLLIQDMYRQLEKLASPAEDYQHNNFDIRTVNMCDDECANGHAHCQHLFIGCSVHVPLMGGTFSARPLAARLYVGDGPSPNPGSHRSNYGNLKTDRHGQAKSVSLETLFYLLLRSLWVRPSMSPRP